MPKWAQVVLVIIVFFVVAGFVESRRVQAMEAWRQAHGFSAIDPFVPAEHPPVVAIASVVTNRDAAGLRWASALTGVSNGTKVTFAELSYSPTAGQTSKWFTIAVWATPGGRADGYAGSMTEGLLTPARAEELLRQVEDARPAI